MNTGKVDVLLGLQWGDEGKGKVVDVLTPKYDVVARFQGGKHAVCPAEFAVALVLDGRSADQVDMLRKIILVFTCLWDTGSLLSVSATGEYKQSESNGYNVLSFHAAKIQKRF